MNFKKKEKGYNVIFKGFFKLLTYLKYYFLIRIQIVIIVNFYLIDFSLNFKAEYIFIWTLQHTQLIWLLQTIHSLLLKTNSVKAFKSYLTFF